MSYKTNLDENQKLHFEKVCSQIIDEYRIKNYLETNDILNVELKQSTLYIDLSLPYPAQTIRDEIASQFETLTVLDFVEKTKVNIQQNIITHSVQHNLKPFKNIKNIIAIASGKGGVGKSTLASNFSLALVKEGAKVGILDADIYGPSIPKMLSISGKPQTKDGKTMEPLQAHGLSIMSIGSLIEEDTPVVWRGALVTRTLIQLLEETNWKNLDYLIVDLPPGTGDIQLTLSQQIPVTGSIIVTTPQDIALLDAVKGLKMFQKVNVPIIGIVENMSYHTCSSCGNKEYIFGEGGGATIASKHQVPLLGNIPLNVQIRQDMDSGCPPLINDINSNISQQYLEIARKATAKLAMKTKDFSASFPTIEIK